MLNLADLAEVFDQFTRETNIVITDQAQWLIVAMINSIETDPHETWEADAQRLEPYYHLWPRLLGELLPRIVRDHRLSRQLTSLDLVYWTVTISRSWTS